MEKYSVSFGQQSFLSFNDWPIPGFMLQMAVFLIVSSVTLVSKSGTSSVDSTSALGLIVSEIILSIPNLKRARMSVLVSSHPSLWITKHRTNHCKSKCVLCQVVKAREEDAPAHWRHLWHFRWRLNLESSSLPSRGPLDCYLHPTVYKPLTQHVAKREQGGICHRRRVLFIFHSTFCVSISQVEICTKLVQALPKPHSS